MRFFVVGSYTDFSSLFFFFVYLVVLAFTRLFLASLSLFFFFSAGFTTIAVRLESDEKSQKGLRRVIGAAFQIGATTPPFSFPKTSPSTATRHGMRKVSVLDLRSMRWLLFVVRPCSSG